jgi:FdhD/NarQ family/Cytochrome bd terminal oxidase subunit I
MWISETRMQPYSNLRRRMGPTGCGLCGIESPGEASRPARRVGAGLHVAPEAISAAIAAPPPAQLLDREIRAVHAAAFWRPGKGIVAVREQVERHNSLERLVGLVASRQADGGSGIVLLTTVRRQLERAIRDVRTDPGAASFIRNVHGHCVGVAIFGRSRVGPWFYLFSTAMVASGTALSAFWIMVNNSWMQVPVAYVMENGALPIRPSAASICPKTTC